MCDTASIAKRMIKQHEGYKEKPYKCLAGKLTIGWGHNMDDSSLPVTLIHGKINEYQATVLLQEGMKQAEKDARSLFPGFNDLIDLRKAVLIDMAFNLGYARLSKFVKFRGAVGNDDYAKASKEMLDSLWARQVGKRAIYLSECMKNGEEPDYD